jgi:glycosyltransferase involved in cell wall biosynthesis
MIKNNLFICLAEDWGRHPTSTQHLIGEFLAQNDVFWVNSISIRSPKVSLYDLKRLFVKLKSWSTQPQQKEFEKLKIFSPLTIPFYSVELIKKINENLLHRQIEKRVERFSNKKPILWLSLPTAGGMVKKFNEILSIYYCSDEWTEFPGVSRKAMIEMEKEVLSKVDMVIVTSEKLYEAKKNYNNNTFIVCHGVNFNHFFKGQYEGMPVPEKLRNVKKPIIGFYGLIASWVDVNLLEYLAQRKPEWSIVLIGESMIDLSCLKKYDNVFLLGSMNYQELPRYSINFDAALMPFKENKLTSFVNPLKMLEYMASGLPVVSTNLPELTKYKRIIKLSSSKEDFLEKIDESLKEKEKKYIQEGIKIARKESWQRKACEMSFFIEKVLSNKELR